MPESSLRAPGQVELQRKGRDSRAGLEAELPQDLVNLVQEMINAFVASDLMEARDLSRRRNGVVNGVILTELADAYPSTGLYVNSHNYKGERQRAPLFYGAR